MSVSWRQPFHEDYREWARPGDTVWVVRAPDRVSRETVVYTRDFGGVIPPILRHGTGFHDWCTVLLCGRTEAEAETILAAYVADPGIRRIYGKVLDQG